MTDIFVFVTALALYIGAGALAGWILALIVEYIMEY
jgi:hypothetical protein